MRTSSMKLTSLLLSLMLASGVLAAPVPAPPTPGIPGFNPPTLGSGVVEEKAPGTMDKVNDGLKGGVKPPTEEVDPITATTEKAAGGDPNAATGLHRRIIPGFDDIAGSGTAGDATGDATSGATGGATGKEGIDAAIADALGGAFIKRADVPPQVGSATTIADSTVDGVKKNGLNNISTPPVGKRAAGPPALSHTGINDEITRASGRSGKRSPDGPVDVSTLSNSGVAGEEAGEIVKGKKTPGSDIVGTVTSGLTRRGGPEGCVKPGDIKGGVDCVVAGVDPNEINNLNDIDASKGATPGATTGSPGFAGVSSPVSGAADGATGGVPKAGDATKIAGDATKGA